MKVDWRRKELQGSTSYILGRRSVKTSVPRMYSWAERQFNHINDENALKQKCAAVENIGQCTESMNQS